MLNSNECQALRIGSMIKNEVVYLNKRKFRWSSKEASALGFTFCTNKSHIFQANFEPKIVLFEKCLKQWQRRKLELMGKITVVKNYALPKLIYALSSLPNPPIETVTRKSITCYHMLYKGVATCYLNLLVIVSCCFDTNSEMFLMIHLYQISQLTTNGHYIFKQLSESVAQMMSQKMFLKTP